MKTKEQLRQELDAANSKIKALIEAGDRLGGIANIMAIDERARKAIRQWVKLTKGDRDDG